MLENLISLLLGFQVGLTYIALGIAVVAAVVIAYQIIRTRSR